MERLSYQYFESRSRSQYNRRCIDGRIVGCSKCVGYCNYSGHPGFLTKNMRKDHDCLRKDCIHYIAREKQQHIISPKKKDKPSELLNTANMMIREMEGLKFLKASATSSSDWILHYVTITNCSPMESLSHQLSQETGVSIKLQKLDYCFDVCAAIIAYH